jgi:hypothetical protein
MISRNNRITMRFTNSFSKGLFIKCLFTDARKTIWKYIKSDIFPEARRRDGDELMIREQRSNIIWMDQVHNTSGIRDTQIC